MLLAIDIGNSNIVFGLFKGKRLALKWSLPTAKAASLKKIPHAMYIEDTIVSSVVPYATAQVERAIRRALKKAPLIIGRDVRAPIENRYSRPEQVGQDRLVNGVAASSIYNKGGKGMIVVIDFGTAVTFDVISKRNEYLGGLIFPGLKLSLENLYRRAALLPKVNIKRPRSLVGGDTKDSMRSGILNGYASLCDGVVAKIASRYKTGISVVATGGDAALIAKYASSIKRVDPDLTLKGLRATYDFFKKSA